LRNDGHRERKQRKGTVQSIAKPIPRYDVGEEGSFPRKRGDDEPEKKNSSTKIGARRSVAQDSSQSSGRVKKACGEWKTTSEISAYWGREGTEGLSFEMSVSMKPESTKKKGPGGGGEQEFASYENAFRTTGGKA